MSRHGSSFGTVFGGWLAIVSLPMLLVFDSCYAMLRGWAPRGDGALGQLHWPVLTAIVASAAFLFISRIRRLLATRRRQWWLASIAILIALLLGELMMRTIRPLAPFHRRWPHARLMFDPDSNLFYGVKGPAPATFNSLGLRGSQPPPRKSSCRVLCLGGSTTECFYLSDQECWPGRLQQLLANQTGSCWVAGAGHDSYASGQHRHFLERCEVTHQVDCVVLLVGGNDLLRALLGLPCSMSTPPFWMRTSIVTCLSELWNGRLQQGLFYDKSGRRWLTLRRARPIPRMPIDIDGALQEFEDHLTHCAEICDRQGLRLILVTQPVLWSDVYTSAIEDRYCYVAPGPPTGPTRTPEECLNLIDRYNDCTYQFCKKRGLTCVDAAAVMNGREAFFYDDLHLNEPGCHKLAQLVANAVSEVAPERHVSGDPRSRDRRATTNGSQVLGPLGPSLVGQ